MLNQFCAIKTLLFCCFILTAQSYFAQKDLNDLKKELNQSNTSSSTLSLLEKLITTYKDNNLDSALYYCNQYNALAEKMEDEVKVAKGYYFYSSIYSASGNFQQLSQYAYPALNAFQDQKNYSGQVDILLILGKMHGAMGEYDKAYKNYKDAIVIAKQIENYDALISINIGLSNTYFLENKLEDTEFYLQKAIDIVHENNLEDSSNYLAKIYTNLGNVHSTGQDDDIAIEYYKKSHNIYKKSNDKFGVSLTAFNIGDTYNYSDQYDSAYKYFNITLQMGKELHNYEELYYAYLGLTELHERKNDYQKALEFQRMKFAYQDSIQIQKYDKAVIELEQQYNAERKADELIAKEKEVQLANKQKEKDKSTIKLLAIGGGILAILLIASLILYKRVSTANQLIREQRNSIDETLKQKEILLQEVHHRVKNNLQLIASLLNLQSMNLESDQAKIAIEESKARVQAIALMHKGLYQDENYGAVNLPSYVKEIVDNLKAISSSSAKRIEFNVSVEEIVLDIDKSVPVGLIISELISNSLKHAFIDWDEGSITLNVKKNGESVILRYQDDGVGIMENFNPLEQESLGYTIISSLSDQINGELKFESYKPFILVLRF